jgi:hypothetical protein
MSGAARVDDVDPIKDFRVYLIKFQEMANRALGDADSDVHRMTRWLEGEAATYWNNQIRKRQEALAKAEEAFRFKRLYKDASGATPSAVEEQKQVKICKERLQHAQEKMANVKKWSKELQKQSTLYRGGVAGFTNNVNAGMKTAYSHLGSILDHLDEYFGITAETGAEPETAGAGAGGSREASEASMSRAAEERPQAPDTIDPSILRGAVPSDQAMLAAKPADPGPLHLACDAVTTAQIAEIAKFSTATAPVDGERIVISPSVSADSRVFLIRLQGARYLGPIEALDSGVYNTISAADLRAGRPDFAELLALPVGYIAVIGPGGLLAVFNDSNQKVL